MFRMSLFQSSPSETREIAKQAYIYGFPIVEEYLTMYAFSIDKGTPPDGPFYSILRLYMPAPEALNGTWRKPPMQTTK